MDAVAHAHARALVVDDEVPLAKIIASYLEREGMSVVLAHDGRAALEAARTQRPDLVVLDIMLPEIDGIEVCRRIRTFSDCYVIMLTARDEEIDKIVGLTTGADDYLVKPFSPRELVARVRALLRRPRGVAGQDRGDPNPAPGPDLVHLGELTVDLGARRAWVAGSERDLTRTEFDLLAAMLRSPRQAFSRRQLIEAVWGPSWFGDEHIVDVHVGHLRRKLGDQADEPRFVRTIRGVGYGMATSSG